MLLVHKHTQTHTHACSEHPDSFSILNCSSSGIQACPPHRKGAARAAGEGRILAGVRGCAPVRAGGGCACGEQSSVPFEEGGRGRLVRIRSVCIVCVRVCVCVGGDRAFVADALISCPWSCENADEGAGQVRPQEHATPCPAHPVCREGTPSPFAPPPPLCLPSPPVVTPGPHTQYQ